MIDTVFRIVDRRASYFVRSAFNRSQDGTEFLRRFHKGEAIQAMLRRPKVVRQNIVALKRKVSK